MSIKKLALLAICAILACFALVGCEEEIGDYEYDWKPEPVVKLEFDLYIITDSAEDEDALNAMTTVNSKLNQYLDGLYDTVLDIHYITEEKYDGEIAALLENGVDETTVSGRMSGGAIVLVRGSEMYNKLVEEDALENLDALLDTNAFGKLNTQITSTMLEAAKTEKDGNEALYVIPNDHIIGEYEYTIIKRDIAEGILNFSAQSELLEMAIVDSVPNEIASELIAAVEANLDKLDVDSVEDVIRVVKGDYNDKAYWESEEQGYICNISKYPEVTEDVVFTAGFAVFNTEDVYTTVNGEQTLFIDAAGCTNRAMEIIYAINADPTARNILQYGVENTHYTLEKNEDGTYTVVVYDDNAYKMNLLYTGDVFNAYCTESVVYKNGEFSSAWTKDVVSCGDLQNKDVVLNK